MVDELTIEWEKLKLTKEEEAAVEYEEEIHEERKAEVALSLLGKFLVKAMKTVMQTIWKPLMGMVKAHHQTKAFPKFLGDKVGTFVKCDEDEMLGMDKALCFRAEVAVFKPLRRGVMVKAREVLDPETPASELQYGAWLRASPLKSHRRNAKSELAEERHLFTAFSNR
ncbi:hypothetical protein Cgig2_011996 [Carnegiea gigantea]|uniref:Uncharacterized protein n=1 Tax=Carnegiea gigantea TaxID=171969 RepID=A0A9Q1KS76_9CARY|nr:hypothetical protein Cgig2_011996 [Carnegiea gigantea]